VTRGPRRRSIPLRTSLWFAPAVAITAGLLLFVAVDLLDLADADLALLPSLSTADWRVVLGAILGAEATVLAVVFSVTMLVLQTAVGQMGPRLIRRFMADPITQCTIAAFVVGIGLSALALLSLRTDPISGEVQPLTPNLAVIVGAITLALLVAYRHRTATAIQVQYVIAGVDRDLRRAIADTGAVAVAAPTPGGLGATEAALLAGLSVLGLPNEVGLPSVFLFRLATFWLPILPGWLALRALQRREAI